MSKNFHETSHSKPRDGGVLDPWNLVYFLQDHAFVITLSVLLGLTLALAYLRWAPRIYSSRAVLEVGGEERPFNSGAPQGGNDTTSAALLKTAEQVIASPAVLSRVITANHLLED